MKLLHVFSQRLYLRIWLAVVVGVAALTLCVAWAWKIAEEQRAQNSSTPPSREMVMRGPDGNVLVEGRGTRVPGSPGDGVSFEIAGNDGKAYELWLAPREWREGRPPPRDGAVAFWLRPPFGFLWMLGLVGIAVIVGVFPIIRRLLKRLENLQRGVKRFGEGDLSVRVPEHGHDEVADLAHQFNAAAARIETLMTSHKSLLANASHELRSPLTRIRMGLEFMGNDPASARAKAEIQRNISELDQLVDEILLASRLDTREVDVGMVESVDLIGLAAEECARIDAELDVLTDGPLDVQGISKLLRRAVRNLLENARRYSQGEIQLTLEKQDHSVEIRVEDHGPGVPREQRERIFEKFYRLPGASERSGGVGLGLSLVRSIAERHGGTVHCEARQDGRSGASFVICLPLS
ncbi:sensor histidine kinase [Comamonas resistens]|uniref:histidine kinase n=1 Tax=Comamonas resistens TaxID=3046670 RepID=A0ABY8STA0_9BURK|nr:HAMP domain-containing sensor histidine kinase [Comamonas resistens]MDL5037126.1 HAMP domain-containing sensor histidine kinase [Comamonas resistens]WHS65675.1 HAMP domain-containing sensor histidine kinase [Comamonas resistens]